MTTGEGDRRLLGGRYALEGRIATGGMGEVWRGRDTVLQRTVAIKVLRSEYADNPTFVERFRAEARNAAALSHPNIAAVLDYGEASESEAGEHVAYLVMELVEGTSLAARLSADGPMEPQAALSMLRQTAAGLAEAHRHGVVHRDVKPANILVRPDGAVKLTDFGIARSTDSVPLTGTGQVIGTAQYMSPEQAKGEPATPASDVYALGLVGYESLTGHAAFEGTNPVTIALQHVVADPQPLPAELPEEVRGLIDSALTKDPGQRISDGGAFLDAVQETLDHEYRADGTTSYTRPVQVVPPAGAGSGSGALRAPAGKQPARRGALLVLLPLAALLLALGTAAFVLGGPGGGEETVVEAPPAAAADPGILLAADDHVGRPFEDVAGELEALGLDVVRVDRATTERPAGTVLAVGPVGTRLAEGDTVRITVAVPPSAGGRPEAPAGTARPLGSDPQVAVDAAPPAAPPAPGRASPDTTPPGTTPGGTPVTTATDPGVTTTAPGSAPTDPGTTAPVPPPTVGPEPSTPPGSPPASTPPASTPPPSTPPTTAPPTSAPPTTAPPTTAPPTSTPPTTAAPSTTDPTTDPTTEPPTSGSPTSEPPATEPPATEPPATTSTAGTATSPADVADAA